MNIALLQGLTGGGVRVPFQFDALLNVDGTILQVESSYYLADKSVNHRHLLITDYDFPENWSSGFPYKSAATVSAPVGDAALIAADVNNFFYDSGGNPNQIPVVSFFQNVDYANKLFCRHQAQLLDVNGVETFEPRVKEIVLYANAKTGAELTKCNSYFSVPIEATTNVIWVAKTGSDATGNGTKANPYLTINKGYNIASGNIIYVKSGTYVENGFATGYLYLDKVCTLQGVGNVIVKAATSTTQIVNTIVAAGTFNLNNLILDGAGAVAQLINIYAAGQTVNANKLFFKGLKTYAIYGGANTTANVTNCVSKHTSVIAFNASGAININTSFLTNTTPSANAPISVINTKCINNISAGIALRVLYNSATIKGNYIKSTGVGIQAYGSAMADAKDVNISYNKFYVENYTGDGSLYGINVLATGSKYNLSITDNFFFQNSTGALGANGGGFIYINDQVAPQILRNVLISNTTSYFPTIAHKFTGDVTSGANKINYNFVKSESLTGVCISIGMEDGHGNIADNSEIIGNFIEGFKKNNPLSDGSIHGILANCGKNMIIKYNYVGHTVAGLVVKTGIQDTYTENGVIYNILEDNTEGVFIRGIAGINVFGNTIYHSDNTYTNAFIAGVIANENSAVAGDQFCENVIVKNNIIYADANSGYLVQFDAHASANGCIAEYNQLYGASYLLYDGVSYSNLSTSQAAGKLLNCEVGNPNLTLGLWPTTPITIGENLDTDYDDGLDITTNWGNTTQVPTVVTKQQSVPWQVGAYVQ